MAGDAIGFTFNDLFGFVNSGKVAATNANAAVTMNEAVAYAQSDVAKEQIQAQQAVEEKKIETMKWLGFGAIATAITYVVLKFLW